ncbi:sensor histidine kinase [Facilibium subflavum]|uniref:sensor histidine kinase n=1 Tax=Facilibium subflavum TaxID=2219058 RepID=UPI000E655D3D|nr:HAMP domain-containing sensor histidine kinase [Facilibium subflavum]
MKTHLAKQTYWILTIGLLLIGFLLSLVGFQLSQLAGSSIYSHMAQRNIVDVFQNQTQDINQLKRRLENVPGMRVHIDTINNTQVASSKLPVFKLHQIRPPFDWTKPFILEYQGHYLSISFSPWNQVTAMIIIYIFAIFVLLGVMFWLCYWALKRLEKVNLLARNALETLASNIHRQISLPVENNEAESLFNSIQKIQNLLKDIVNKRTEMLAAISHDLKTPITRLKLRVELLSESQEKEALLKDVNNIEAMVNAILTFSKNFLQEENAVSFDFSELITSIAHDAQDLGHAIKLIVEKPVIYTGKVMSIKRAIVNILDNAIKYGQDEVKMQLFSQDKYVVCQISDQGPGVSVALYERLFEPFFRADQSRNADVSGSGLGLSIAKEVIEGHGGKIKLSPNKPKGLVVQILLPC